MKIWAVLLLNLALATAGLAAYRFATAEEGAPAVGAPAPSPDSPEAPPEPDPVAVARLDANARRLAALETSVYTLRKQLADVSLAVATNETPEEAMSEPRLEALERRVMEVRSRRIFERREHNLHIAVKELRLGLTELERRTVVRTIQASHDEVGRHAAKLRGAGPIDSDALNAGYDKILKRYHEKIRKIVTPAQAEKIIERFMALR